MSAIRIIDAARLLASPPPRIEWAIQNILPAGTVGDIFGPPGEGKSSLTLDFAIAVASGAGNWFGLPCIAGPVALLGGERSGDAAFARDLHRASQGRNIDPGMLILPQNECGDCPPMWAWNKQLDRWVTTPWGKQVNDWLIAIKPVLILIDTLASAASGSDIVDQPQQYALGTTLRQWAKTLGDPTVLTISHTNQTSAIQEVARRLHYLSRAGGNGLPGALRWICGVSRLRGGEMDMVPSGHDYDPRDPVKRFLAFGVSKHNEMSLPLWTPERPAIFQMKPDGGLVMVPTTSEAFMAHYPDITGDNDKRPRQTKKKKADVDPIKGPSRRDSAYWLAKNGDDHVPRSW
ncbi:AAA family ATPase [Acidithiobacillus sp.]